MQNHGQRSYRHSKKPEGTVENLKPLTERRKGSLPAALNAPVVKWETAPKPRWPQRKRPVFCALLLCAGCLLACPKTGGVPREKPQGPEEVGVMPVHTVVKGETLYGIARSHRVPLPELLAVNRLSEKDTLHIGQRLWIPQTSAASKPASADVAVSDATASNSSVEKPAAAALGFALEWPLKGMLYAKFGKKGKEVHDGIDLAAPLGTPVKAAAAGKVLYAGEQKGYGKIVILEHAAGWVTLYAHNHELRTETGATVASGAMIATVGQSGRTSGPHLHFELRKNGIPVDPLPYLKAAP